MLRAANVRLRPVERADLDLLLRWRNDPDNWRLFFNKLPLSAAGQETWFARLAADSGRLLFMIQAADDEQAIGCVGLGDIDYPNQCAEYGNHLIGSLSHRGHGLATEASRLLIEYAFAHLNLHRLHLRVFKDNIAAAEFYGRLGFVEEGVERQRIFTGGRFQDVLRMGLLRAEYRPAATPPQAGDA